MSVIVTTRNSARTLEACLASARRQTHPDIELILVDNSSTDLTLEIASRHCDVVATKGPERSAQRNYGAELSHGEQLLFIDSDMVLEADVVSHGVHALEDPAVQGVAIPELSFGEGFWTRCRMLERQCYIGDDAVEAARMYRRADFFDAGGFDLDLNGAEDWDLSKRVTRGNRVSRTTAIIHHDEGRTTLRSSFAKRRYYALGYLHYLRKHRKAAIPQGNPVLRRAFFRHWRTLVRHPLLTAGMFTIKTVELGAVLQVAIEQSAPGWIADRLGPVRRRRPTLRRPVPAEARQLRPLLVTFGSVLDAHGGVQTRARLTAETFTDLGLPMAIVSTREPAPDAFPAWARTLRVPAKKPIKGFSRELARLIGAEAATSTVLVATNAMFMPAIAASRAKLPLIWDTNECQTLHYRRLPRTAKNRLRYLVWLGLERWAARRCVLAIAIGEEEAGTWKATHPRLRGKLAVVDHATLATWRDPRKARETLQLLVGRDLDGPVLLFLGTLRAKHNAAASQWILDELVPGLRPETTVVVCGPGSEAIGLRPGPGASVVGLGAVDDVDSVVAAADLCLAPLAAGAGVKTKVLHYLAHGKRIVGTPTAFEGLADAPGCYSVNLADFAEAVRTLCQQREPPEVAGDRARAQLAWVDEHHGRAHVAEQWRKVLACLSST